MSADNTNNHQNAVLSEPPLETNDLQQQDAPLPPPDPRRLHRRKTDSTSSNVPDPIEVSPRHSAKCTICSHPQREVIEEEFVNWHSVWHLARQYKIDDYRSIYRHAVAARLIERRRNNMRWCLDSILECAPGKVTADAVIRAIRAHACLTEDNRWIEPASHVEFSVVAPRQTAAVVVTPVASPGTRSLRDVSVPVAPAISQAGGRSERAVVTAEATIIDIDPEPE